MVKIIYPVPESFPDNRARFIQIINTCYSLAEIGCKVFLITSIKNKYPMKEIFKFYGLKEIDNLKILPIFSRELSLGKIKITINTLFNLNLLKTILSKFDKSKDTVIYLRHLKLAAFLIKLRKFHRFPIFFEIHEIFHLTTTNRRKLEKLKKIEQEVYSNSDCLVCITQALKAYLIDEMKIKNKIFVIPDAVKKEWFNIIPESPEYIIYCGSLYSWKGVDVLIKAMQYLPEEKLLILGSGKNLEKLKELSKTIGVSERIIFAGSVNHSHVPEYLAKAKIAVLPNIKEKTSLFSSPLKLFEYMAAGLPIVASDLPVLREILTEGENALFFEAGNPVSLANAIKKFLANRDLYEKVSINNKKTSNLFSYEKRAKDIYTIICRELK